MDPKSFYYICEEGDRMPSIKSMVNMKKFFRKLGEMAAMAIIPILIDAVVDLLGDLKKKVEAEIEAK